MGTDALFRVLTSGRHLNGICDGEAPRKHVLGLHEPKVTSTMEIFDDKRLLAKTLT